MLETNKEFTPLNIVVIGDKNPNTIKIYNFANEHIMDITLYNTMDTANMLYNNILTYGEFEYLNAFLKLIHNIFYITLTDRAGVYVNESFVKSRLKEGKAVCVWTEESNIKHIIGRNGYNLSSVRNRYADIFGNVKIKIIGVNNDNKETK